MIADGLASERARADRRHDVPPRPHAPTSADAMAALIPSGASVLWIGPIGAGDAADLEGRGCPVRAVPISSGRDRGGLHPSPVEVDGLEFGRGRFDVVVAPDLLGRVARPEAMLESLRHALPAGGRLMASVPNAAHPAVVAALARGASPYADGGALDPGQSRLFTREALVSAIEAADFAVGWLRGVADAGGEVAEWRVVAHALPVPGLERLQEEFRREAVARDEAERAAESLRHLLAQSRRAIDAACARVTSARARERSAYAALAEAHEAMRIRDEEYGATVKDLLARLEEVEPLRRECDAAHRHALAAEARCRALELRVEHVVMEWPRRVARKVRSLFARRGA